MRLEPTRKDALVFWRAFVWRLGLCIVLIWLLLGLILGLSAAAGEWTTEKIESAGSVLFLTLGLPLTLLASWECLYRIIGLRIGGKELVIEDREGS